MKNTVFSIVFTLSAASFLNSVVCATEAPKTPVPIAKIGTTVLTEEDLRKDMGMSLFEAENQVFSVKKTWVDQKTKTQYMEQAAKEEKLSLAAWQKREIDAKIVPATQQEIDQLAPRFAQRGTQPSPEQLVDMKSKAAKYLEQQKRSQREGEVFSQLLQKYGPAELFFTRPEAPQLDLPLTKKSLVKGPENAKVTVIEFTDFECPWCKRSQENVKAVEKAFPDQVKYVDKMFPLVSIHPRAMPSAEAAYCAKDQGKYWEMREKLFPSQTMSDADFKQFAKEIGINVKKFESCMSSHKSLPLIEADMADAQRFGVKGTPAFFVNGAPTQFNQLLDAVRTALGK